MNISTKQFLVLDFIKKFIAEKSYSPTVREIMEGLSLKSPSTVHEHLKHLQDFGIITFKPAKSRTIELLVENEYAKGDIGIIKIPLIDSNDDILEVPIWMANGYDVNSLKAYKIENAIYIVNIDLKGIKTRLSLYKDSSTYLLANKSDLREIGTVVSKFETF